MAFVSQRDAEVVQCGAATDQQVAAAGVVRGQSAIEISEQLDHVAAEHAVIAQSRAAGKPVCTCSASIRASRRVSTLVGSTDPTSAGRSVGSVGPDRWRP
jgi:hypothetical protein